jgi:hypothetical protein
MSVRRLLPPLLLASSLAAVSAAAFAAPPVFVGPLSQRGVQDRPVGRGDDALSDSVRRVERSTRSQVLSAERVPFDGRDVNRIKTVDDRGRVRIFMDDPSAVSPKRLPDAPTRGNDD